MITDTIPTAVNTSGPYILVMKKLMNIPNNNNKANDRNIFTLEKSAIFCNAFIKLKCINAGCANTQSRLNLITSVRILRRIS
jgi:hypothetical protein|tara:strand:+ start:6783 stop:7028 length:246 start_codon:yes stop_codon:yes gene_type:complete